MLPSLLSPQILTTLPCNQFRYLDASILLPGQSGDPELDFAQLALPGAVRFRIDEISDRTDGLPHMVPGAALFARAMTALGITRETPLVFYDRAGSIGACRAHWLASLFGHECASVLDGGLDGIMRAGIVLSDLPMPCAEEKSPYVARSRYALLAGKGDVLAALDDEGQVVLDARSKARFTAVAPEPRPGVRGGHMPGAINLPYGELLDDEGRFLPSVALQARLLPAVEGRKAITSCGSGLTAATLTMGLRLAGVPVGQLYDGSWAEWGSDPSLPVVID